MGQPASWGRPEGQDPDRGLELYKLAVEEYRFQAQFNWSRTQYLLVFSTAILAAGAAVAQRPGRSAALVFLLGAVAAAASVLVVRAQHGYYRAARDRVRRFEEDLDIPERQRLDTTSAQGARKQRVKVQHVVVGLFAALVVAHTIGAVIVLGA